MTASTLCRLQVSSQDHREAASLRLYSRLHCTASIPKTPPGSTPRIQWGAEPQLHKALAAAQQEDRQLVQEVPPRTWRQQVPELMSLFGTLSTFQWQQSTWGQTEIWIGSSQPRKPYIHLHQPQDVRGIGVQAVQHTAFLPRSWRPRAKDQDFGTSLNRSLATALLQEVRYM